MALSKPISPRWRPNYPLGNGLKFFLPVNGPSDVGSARDCISSLNLSATGGARTGQGGIVCDSTKGFEATLPASLRLPLPLTIACKLRFLGTPVSDTGYFGLIRNNNNTSPYISAGLYVDPTGLLGLFADNGGTTPPYLITSSAITASSRVGLRDVHVAVLTATTRTLYLNGVLIASSSGSYVNPGYDASALVAAGNYTGVTQNPNCVIEGGAIWNRALSGSEVRQLSADFFAPVRPMSGTAALFGATQTAPPQTAFPAACLMSF
jgi:hypothetical protein